METMRTNLATADLLIAGLADGLRRPALDA
jgi:hypothetical protein